MKELKVLVVDVDTMDSYEDNSADIPIERFMELAKKQGYVLSVGHFSFYVNEGDIDNLTNSYVRFAWVDEDGSITEVKAEDKVIMEN